MSGLTDRAPGGARLKWFVAFPPGSPGGDRVLSLVTESTSCGNAP